MQVRAVRVDSEALLEAELEKKASSLSSLPAPASAWVSAQFLPLGVQVWDEVRGKVSMMVFIQVYPHAKVVVFLIWVRGFKCPDVKMKIILE